MKILMTSLLTLPNFWLDFRKEKKKEKGGIRTQNLQNSLPHKQQEPLALFENEKRIDVRKVKFRSIEPISIFFLLLHLVLLRTSN